MTKEELLPSTSSDRPWWRKSQQQDSQGLTQSTDTMPWSDLFSRTGGSADDSIAMNPPNNREPQIKADLSPSLPAASGLASPLTSAASIGETPSLTPLSSLGSSSRQYGTEYSNAGDLEDQIAALQATLALFKARDVAMQDEMERLQKRNEDLKAIENEYVQDKIEAANLIEDLHKRNQELMQATAYEELNVAVNMIEKLQRRNAELKEILQRYTDADSHEHYATSDSPQGEFSQRSETSSRQLDVQRPQATTPEQEHTEKPEQAQDSDDGMTDQELIEELNDYIEYLETAVIQLGEENQAMSHFLDRLLATAQQQRRLIDNCKKQMDSVDINCLTGSKP